MAQQGGYIQAIPRVMTVKVALNILDKICKYMLLCYKPPCKITVNRGPLIAHDVVSSENCVY